MALAVPLASLPEQLCSEVPTAADTNPGVVLLAALHAYLARTNNQEVTTIALHVDSRHPVPVPCPPVEQHDTIVTHAAKLHAAVSTKSTVPSALYQAAVVFNTSDAEAYVTASGLGVVLLVTGSNSRGSVLKVDLVFSQKSFTEQAAVLMAQHFQVFLSAIVGPAGSNTTSSTDLPTLLQSPLMDPQERQLVLEGFNQTGVEYDTSALVHTLFAARAKANPEAPCVVFEGYVFSYGEIDAAANRIASYLRNKAGVFPGDIVGVLVLRSPVMIATLLGVFKAGAGYLPLDHHHPEARIEFMLEDAAVRAVITQPDLLHKLPSSQTIHTLLVHPDKALPPSLAPKAPAPTPAALNPRALGAAAAESPDWTLGQLGGPETTCYIIYTSGSTGKPKGVVVLHKGLTAYTAWFRGHFGITAQDVFIQKTPTNFDASVDEMWTCLSSGATLVVAAPEAHRDVHSVMTLISRYSVTTASAVPSQVHLLAREILSAHSPGEAAAGTAPCSSLKRVLSGGEALTTTMARDIKAALPNCELHNTYGPTETTVGITSWPYTPPAASEDSQGPQPAAATIPIGRGIYNSRLYVLDTSLQPVPVGVPGQLFISGVQVAGGYLHRPDLNETTFVNNPFYEGSGSHTEKMYRTGDLVRWLPGQHACLEFLGRVDHQVKLRGFRIELQEVEAVMGALSGVRQVVTALAKNPATDQDHLVAWVSPADLQPHSLLQQLQGALPEYMIPSVVVLMDQLPLLVSEKVDRKALPAPDFTRDVVSLAGTAAPAAAAAAKVPVSSSSDLNSCSVASSSSSSSADALAEFVAGVWSEVLGLQSAAAVTLEDDFFALGGNSLLAGRMNSRLRTELSLPGMSGMMIYQHPKLSAFVQAVTEEGPVLPQRESSYSCNSAGSIGRCALLEFVADTWTEVLGLQSPSGINLEDDFFALGGNSLLAGRMNSRLRMGLTLPDMSGMMIYQHPKLSAFVQAVSAAGPLVPGAPATTSSSSGYSDSVDHTSVGSCSVSGGKSISPLQAHPSYSGFSVSSAVSDSSSVYPGLRRFNSCSNISSSSGSFSFESVVRQILSGAPEQPHRSSSSHISSSQPSFLLPANHGPDGQRRHTVSSAFAMEQPADAVQLPPVFSNSTGSRKGFGSLVSKLSFRLSEEPSLTASMNVGMDQLPIAIPPAVPTAARRTSDSGFLTKLPQAFSLPRRLSQAADQDLNPELSLPISVTGGAGSNSNSRRASEGGMSLSKLPFSLKTLKDDQGTSSDQQRPSRQSAEDAGEAGARRSSSSGGKAAEQQYQQQQVKPSLALATLVQVVGLCCTSGVWAMLGLAPMLISMYLIIAWGYRALLILPALELGSFLLVALSAIAGKWLMIGRYKEGESPLWGSYYLRHWLAHLFVLAARQSFVPLIRRTRLLNWFYRALGVKIGRNAVIDTDDLLGYDVIELMDDCVLDAACGISAITFEAGKPSDKFPTGTMKIKAAVVGERAVVGPHAMVVSGRVEDDAVVLPCSATSNPQAMWAGSSRPSSGPEARAAVRTQEKPLGALAGFAAMWITNLLISTMAYPLVVAFWQLWLLLAGVTLEEQAVDTWSHLADAFKPLQCWLPNSINMAGADETCYHLMWATMVALVVLPVSMLVAGQLAVFLVIPFKWLLAGKAKPSTAASAAPKSWFQCFRHHLLQCLLEHPSIRAASFVWTGTAMFNAWLRALGAKVGKQAWIGEDLHLHQFDLVEIGDAVSICSGVSMLPSAALGAAKIKVMGGSDVTNQTALYPGVTVKPGAVLGVFTYAEAGRTFPRYSITQGPMVLSAGQADPPAAPAADKPSRTNSSVSITASSSISQKAAPTGALYTAATADGAADAVDPAETRLVSWAHYLRFNVFYSFLMVIIMPLNMVAQLAPFYVITVLLLFRLGWWAALLLSPVSYAVELITTVAWMALLKKILMPRCKGSHPFYSYMHTAWMIDGILLYFHQTGLLRSLSGSQMAVWFYRAMGSKIGKGVLLNGLHSNEPDCLTVGDGTVIDEMTFVMAHTVENRCLKFHDVVIGSGVTIGCGSCVLPGCHVSDGATMGDVSLLMKGETMPPGSVWRGVPAVPCRPGAAAVKV